MSIENDTKKFEIPTLSFKKIQITESLKIIF